MSYVCEDCREEINREADVCPHCDHRGGEAGGILGVVMIILGGLFSVTVIGLPIGVPLMYFGYRRVKSSGEVSPGVEVES